MTIATTLENAQNAKEARRQDAETAYCELAERIAADGLVTGDEVLDVLEAADKTEADLRADVERLKSCERLPGIIAELGQLREQQTEIAAEVADLQEQARVIDESLSERRAAVEQTRTRINHLSKSRDELLRQFPDAVPEFADAKKRFRQFAEQASELSKSLRRANIALIERTDKRNHLQSRQGRRFDDDHKAEIETADEAVARAQAEVDRITEALNDAVTERDEAKRQMRSIG